MVCTLSGVERVEVVVRLGSRVSAGDCFAKMARAE